MTGGAPPDGPDKPGGNPQAGSPPGYAPTPQQPGYQAPPAPGQPAAYPPGYPNAQNYGQPPPYAAPGVPPGGYVAPGVPPGGYVAPGVPPGYPPPGGYAPPGYPPPGGYGAPTAGGYGAPPAGYGAPGYPGANPDAPYGIDPVSGMPFSDKQKMVAGLLQIFVGWAGAGRFYTGHTGIAVAQLLVGWLTCGLWPFIDGILMLLGKVTDAQGRPLRDG